jgi:tRNA pseudouridine55 synthase
MIKTRKILNTSKTGYVGTLDPFATGVLPIAVGEARKFIQFIEESEKNYIFTVVFGAITDTLDKNGKLLKIGSHIPTESEISSNLSNFIGEIEQIPPVFSAVKIRGKRACDRIREGEQIEIPARHVKIFDFRLLQIAQNEATFTVICSKGTYIRSLARDFAEKLGSLAYVKTLRRTKSGFFSINNAIPLEKLQKIGDTSSLAGVLASVESPLDDIPALYLGSQSVTRLQNGLMVPVKNSGISPTNVRIFGDGIFRGIGFVSDEGMLKPVRMCVNDKKIGE